MTRKGPISSTASSTSSRGRGKVDRARFESFAEERGVLIPVEGSSLDFDIERVFVLSDLKPGFPRGNHANLDSHVIFLVAGQVKITTHDGEVEESHILDFPGSALILSPPVWRRIEALTEGSVCAVISSASHSEENYIRDFDAFLSIAGSE